MSLFSKATKTQSRLRLALIGPSGSGKTYSALEIAAHLGGSVAVIDTEHGSASKYADRFGFDTCQLSSFHPQQYINVIQAAAGYDVLIIDSLSHAWMGKDGALEQVDRIAKRLQSSSTFMAWRDVTPLHNALVEAMLACPNHLIVTMRSKTEYVIETNEKGKAVPRKVGMAPIQRDGLEYEFDVCGEMNLSNELIITKSRCPALSGQMIAQPGEQMALTLKHWLAEGEAPVVQLNRDALMQQIDEAIRRLNWTTEDAKHSLKAQFRVSSRQALTDAQLVEFLTLLQAQAAPDGATAIEQADRN